MKLSLAVLLIAASAARRRGVAIAPESCIDDAFVFDAHVHVVNRQFYHGGDMGERVADGQFDLPRAKEGGSRRDVLFAVRHRRLLSAAIRGEAGAALDRPRADSVGAESRQDRAGAERLRHRAHQPAGKIAAVLDLEGGFDLDGDLGVLAQSVPARACDRRSLSAHNWANNFADSCCSAPKYNGLNERGRAVVREMNRLGMVINVSHTSDQTIAQTVERQHSAGRGDASRHAHAEQHPAQHAGRSDAEDRGEGRCHRLPDRQRISQRESVRLAHQARGKPFWDTTEIANRKEQLTIEEIDRKVAPQFPMVGMKHAAGDSASLRTNGSASSRKRSRSWVRITSCSAPTSTAVPLRPAA